MYKEYIALLGKRNREALKVIKSHPEYKKMLMPFIRLNIRLIFYYAKRGDNA